MQILIINPRRGITSLIKDLEQDGHTIDLLTSGYHMSCVAVLKDYPSAIIATDINDFKEKIWELAKHKKYDYIVASQMDDQSLIVAEVNQSMGLKGASVSAITSISSKDSYYKIWEELKIPCPKLWNFSRENNVITLDKNIKFPCVIKPATGTGSNGVEVFNNATHLRMRLHYSDQAILLQEYIQGDTISIIGHISNGVVNIDMLYDINVFFPVLVEIESSWPSKHQWLSDTIKNYIDIFCKHIGLDNCPFMLDALVKDGEIYFVDFGARTSLTVKLMEYVGNPHYLRDMVYNITSNKGIKLNYSGAVTQRILELPKGKVEKIKCNRSDLADELYLPEEEIVEFKRDWDAYKSGYAIITGETLDQVYEKYNILKNSIQVTYETNTT